MLQNGRKYLIKIKSYEFFSKKIWKKFKNKIIDRNKLSESHQDELDHLDEYSEKITLKYFDRKTWLSCIRKNTKGFIVYRLCSKVDCDLKFKIQINIITQQVTVRFKDLCEHKDSVNNNIVNHQAYDSDDEESFSNVFSNSKFLCLNI